LTSSIRIDEAIERAADAVTSWQCSDGSFRGHNLAGPMFIGATIACEAALGSLQPEHGRLAERSLRAAQLPDGGLVPWPSASRSNAEATLYLCAGLRAVGVPDHDPAMRAATARLAELGGARAAGPLAGTIGALVGVVPTADLPRTPAALALLPGHDTLVARLFGVNALLPLRTLPFLWEGLRAGASAARPGPLRSCLRARSAQSLEQYVREHQSPSGGIAGVPIFTLLGLCCLAMCGVDKRDPAMERGLGYVRRVYRETPLGLEVEPFESSHWDTAHMVRVLAQVPTERHRRAARRAADWLVLGQSNEPSPTDWQTPPPGARSSGGWSWQPGNARNPDFDTTAEVLSALGELAAVSTADRRALGGAIERGVAWLLDFQNPDGGWAAFSHGKPRPPRGALYLAQGGPLRRVRSWLAENGDPSTADIVGRVLYGLAAADPSIGRHHPRVRAATRFLIEHQIPETGAWWGRWAINYLAGTAYVVSGLARAGAAVASPWIQRALDWMITCQNPDGGWGESTDSYLDPRQCGRGPSTVSLTGLVTWALQIAGRREHPAVERGVQYLLSNQRPDGSFHDTRCFSTMFPLRSYWLNDTYPTYFALEALLVRRG
jgi:squalene-hopene/tetraprenyl-beta-curcumene cyclase